MYDKMSDTNMNQSGREIHTPVEGNQEQLKGVYNQEIMIKNA